MEFRISNYPQLVGSIIYFERYMMVTTPTLINRFKRLDGNFWIVSNGSAMGQPMKTLRYRKAGLIEFNHLLEAIDGKGDLTKIDHFGTGLIEFKPESKHEDNLHHLKACSDNMMDFIADFCLKYQTIALVASHFAEYDPKTNDNHHLDIPHMHVLYLKNSDMQHSDQLGHDFNKYFANLTTIK